MLLGLPCALTREIERLIARRAARRDLSQVPDVRQPTFLEIAGSRKNAAFDELAYVARAVEVQVPCDFGLRGQPLPYPLRGGGTPLEVVTLVDPCARKLPAMDGSRKDPCDS